MVWISLFFLSLGICAKELPKFLTKHATDTIRFITDDGRYAYIQKKPGVLGIVTSFRSVDFISDSGRSDFTVKDSRFKRRLVVETIPDSHHDFNVIKNHKILIIDWGKTQTFDIGFGRNAKLHLEDEWITYYDTIERLINVQNVVTQKKFQIKLSPKVTPFYFPEVEMISSDTIVYTDINEKGYSALIQYNLITQKNNVILKSTQNGTRLELCQEKDYLAIGEFPYDDVARSSRILQIKLSGTTNLSGYSTIYNSSDSDLGNMVCKENSIFFIKTLTHNRQLNYKQTEAVILDLKNSQVKTLTELNHVSQLINMDGRILIPLRGDFYVLEGSANLTDDKLKTPGPNEAKEELPLEL